MKSAAVLLLPLVWFYVHQLSTSSYGDRLFLALLGAGTVSARHTGCTGAIGGGYVTGSLHLASGQYGAGSDAAQPLGFNWNMVQHASDVMHLTHAAWVNQHCFRRRMHAVQGRHHIRARSYCMAHTYCCHWVPSLTSSGTLVFAAVHCCYVELGIAVVLFVAVGNPCNASQGCGCRGGGLPATACCCALYARYVGSV